MRFCIFISRVTFFETIKMYVWNISHVKSKRFVAAVFFLFDLGKSPTPLKRAGLICSCSWNNKFFGFLKSGISLITTYGRIICRHGTLFCYSRNKFLLKLKYFCYTAGSFFCQYKIMKKIWVLSFLLFSFKQVVRAGRTKRGP
jgi:hypothetical protein